MNSPVSPGRQPVAILGIPFDNVTFDEALNRIEVMIASRKMHYVVTANVDFLVQAARDAELRRILVNAHMVLCDGTPLVWASRWLGNPLPERVAGADIVPQLIRVAAEHGQRLFFLGATPKANAQAADNVRRQFPGAIIAGHYSPPFAPLDKMNHAEIIERVREARPDLLFVAFGCPKAEKWIAKHYRALEVPVVIGVGATIDFLAGRMKRAPQWMQRSGTEWLFRLCQEPKRLFRRYANDLWHFSRGLAQQAIILSKCRNNRQSRPAQLAPENGQSNRPSLQSQDQSSNWQWLRLPPKLDKESIPGGAEIWRRAEQDNCVLDMTDVGVIDSTGVAHLLRLQRNIRANGKQLALVAPNGPVHRALRVMHVMDAFVPAENDGAAETPVPEDHPEDHLMPNVLPSPLKESIS